MKPMMSSNCASPQFSASLVVNHTNQMKQFEAEAFQRVFDNASLGQEITGSKQSFRKWIEENLHDGIHLSIERTKKSSNTIGDNGLKLNISINETPFHEKTILQPLIQFMDQKHLLYRPQTDRMLILWGKNLQNSLSKLSAALVDTFGWEYKGNISKNKRLLEKFYKTSNDLPEDQRILRQKPTVKTPTPELQPA